MAASSGAPAYQQITHVLRQEILDGRYPPGAPFMTQRGLCERFGVSSTTAVRVLNDLAAEGLVSRRRGRGTFIATASERRPAGPGAGAGGPVISCIIHNLHNSYVGSIVSGIESVRADLGYRLQLTDTDESPRREEDALRQAATSDVAGVLLYPVQGREHAAALVELQNRGIPVVMMDRYRPEVVSDAVLVDNEDLGYRITRELVALGHERIATLWSETDCTSVHERLGGHLRALREHRLPIFAELTALRGFVYLDDDGRRHLLRGLLDQPEPPTALLCSNSYVLAAAVEDLVALGVELPGAIELAAMDDAGPYMPLPVSALRAALPARELGRQAALLLHERVTAEGPLRGTRRVVLPAEILAPSPPRRQAAGTANS
jgi:DNA-binding LacI/PurR family transcriptional regulator